MSKHLIDCFFLSFTKEGEARRVESQGRVLSFLPSGRMIVQMYSWIDGEESTKRIVDEKEFSTWEYFDSAEDWKNTADMLIKFSRQFTERAVIE
jgi:hypothetical protein